MERRFPGELAKACRAENEIVETQARMGMIHEAFFVIFALIVAVMELGILVFAWLAGGLSVGEVDAVIGEVFSRWKKKTVICMAHRLNSIRGCGRVIAMKEGRIVGDGSFEELLETNDYFRKLYETGNAP